MQKSMLPSKDLAKQNNILKINQYTLIPFLDDEKGSEAIRRLEKEGFYLNNTEDLFNFTKTNSDFLKEKHKEIDDFHIVALGREFPIKCKTITYTGYSLGRYHVYDDWNFFYPKYFILTSNLYVCLK